MGYKLKIIRSSILINHEDKYTYYIHVFGNDKQEKFSFIYDYQTWEFSRNTYACIPFLYLLQLENKINDFHSWFMKRRIGRPVGTIKKSKTILMKIEINCKTKREQ